MAPTEKDRRHKGGGQVKPVGLAGPAGTYRGHCGVLAGAFAFIVQFGVSAFGATHPASRVARITRLVKVLRIGSLWLRAAHRRPMIGCGCVN